MNNSQERHSNRLFQQSQGLVGLWPVSLSVFLFLVQLVSFSQVAPLHAAEKVLDRTIIGYAAPLTVRPGGKVDFMASAIGGGTYEANRVRVVNGDSVRRYSEHFYDIPVETSQL
jgi:hypothetical protein